ncbi:MAG: protein TolQ [Syntrophales bacterium]|nr:protein TolQ [Syntrophales bacterium]
MTEWTEISLAGFGGHFQGTLLNMILEAGIVVQLVLIILLGFSVVSWAIIMMKFVTFRRIKAENNAFSDVYLKGQRLAEIFSNTKNLKNSTLAGVFRSGYSELVKISQQPRDPQSVKGNPQNIDAIPVFKGIDNVERAISQAIGMETSKLESLLGFLATTGNACPFIGLFGTVWGIMDTFKGIGIRGSATLAVVAPGISEALIATAAGLAAAIPAVIFYNYYLSKIRVFNQEMESFGAELVNVIQRNLLKI